MAQVNSGVNRLRDACPLDGTCLDAFALKLFLSLTYLKLSYLVFAFFGQVLLATYKHLWCSLVDSSCLVCPLHLSILKRDTVVKSEADHEGVEALELLDHVEF